MVRHVVYCCTQSLYFSSKNPGKTPSACVCVCCAVTATSDVATVDFSVAVKSRDTFPQRVELVFESPSRQSSRHRGRSRVDVCHYSAQVETSCRHYRQVRYRWYSGSGRSYVIYDVTATLRPAWDFCRPQPCRFFLLDRIAVQSIRCGLLLHMYCTNETGFGFSLFKSHCFKRANVKILSTHYKQRSQWPVINVKANLCF